MLSSQYSILIVEDEAPIRRFLRATLTDEGYRVSEAATGSEGLRVAADQPPDVVILDLGLPDQEGQSVLTSLREWFTGPIIILSARDDEAQKIAALDGGADDYLTKPFGVGELLARIRSAMRHVRRTGPDSQVVIGALRVDLNARLVFRGDTEVHLTPIEYKLLTTMIQHVGKVLTHRFLLRAVWGPASSQENHYLRVFVASLRKKLEEDPTQPRYLLTQPGVGYRLSVD